jgi:molybdopterin/thiamine biosynthesis adenylyltransferase
MNLGHRPASSLVFCDGALAGLRLHMLAESPLETACLVLARAVRLTDGRYRLVVGEIITLRDADYVARTETRLELTAEVLADATKRARSEGLALFLAHTHPVRGSVGPSSIDKHGEKKWVPAVRRRVPDVPHGRLIIGVDSVHAAIIHDDATEQAVRVFEVGTNLTVATPTDEPAAVGNPTNQRQVLAFGVDGQRRLDSLHFGVVGCGGTGSVVVQQLAHLGVRTFTLVDSDVVEASNLNRLVGATVADVGRPKVDVLKDAITTTRSTANVRGIRADVCDAATARLLLDCDFFFCCTDSEGSRAVLNQLAYQYLLPGIDLGVVIRVREGLVTHISGRVQMLTPSEPCLVCAEALDSEQVRRDLLSENARASDTYIDGAEVPQPAVISINSAAASMAVTMMLAAVTGIPVASRHQRIRFETGVVTRVSVAARSACPVCSTGGALGRADHFQSPGRR